MPNAWLALWCDELDACDADLSIGTGDSERGIAPAYLPKEAVLTAHVSRSPPSDRHECDVTLCGEIPDA